MNNFYNWAKGLGRDIINVGRRGLNNIGLRNDNPVLEQQEVPPFDRGFFVKNYPYYVALYNIDRPDINNDNEKVIFDALIHEHTVITNQELRDIILRFNYGPDADDIQDSFFIQTNRYKTIIEQYECILLNDVLSIIPDIQAMETLEDIILPSYDFLDLYDINSQQNNMLPFSEQLTTYETHPTEVMNIIDDYTTDTSEFSFVNVDLPYVNDYNTYEDVDILRIGDMEHFLKYNIVIYHYFDNISILYNLQRASFDAIFDNIDNVIDEMQRLKNVFDVAFPRFDEFPLPFNSNTLYTNLFNNANINLLKLLKLLLNYTVAKSIALTTTISQDRSHTPLNDKDFVAFYAYKDDIKRSFILYSLKTPLQESLYISRFININYVRYAELIINQDLPILLKKILEYNKRIKPIFINGINKITAYVNRYNTSVPFLTSLDRDAFYQNNDEIRKIFNKYLDTTPEDKMLWYTSAIYVTDAVIAPNYYRAYEIFIRDNKGKSILVVLKKILTSIIGHEDISLHFDVIPATIDRAHILEESDIDFFVNVIPIILADIQPRRGYVVILKRIYQLYSVNNKMYKTLFKDALIKNEANEKFSAYLKIILSRLKKECLKIRNALAVDLNVEISEEDFYMVYQYKNIITRCFTLCNDDIQLTAKYKTYIDSNDNIIKKFYENGYVKLLSNIRERPLRMLLKQILNYLIRTLVIDTSLTNVIDGYPEVILHQTKDYTNWYTYRKQLTKIIIPNWRDLYYLNLSYLDRTKYEELAQYDNDSEKEYKKKYDAFYKKASLVFKIKLKKILNYFASTIAIPINDDIVPTTFDDGLTLADAADFYEYRKLINKMLQRNGNFMAQFRVKKYLPLLFYNITFNYFTLLLEQDDYNKFRLAYIQFIKGLSIPHSRYLLAILNRIKFRELSMQIMDLPIDFTLISAMFGLILSNIDIDDFYKYGAKIRKVIIDDPNLKSAFKKPSMIGLYKTVIDDFISEKTDALRLTKFNDLLQKPSGLLIKLKIILEDVKTQKDTVLPKSNNWIQKISAFFQKKKILHIQPGQIVPDILNYDDNLYDLLRTLQHMLETSNITVSDSTVLKKLSKLIKHISDGRQILTKHDGTTELDNILLRFVNIKNQPRDMVINNLYFAVRKGIKDKLSAISQDRAQKQEIADGASFLNESFSIDTDYDFKVKSIKTNNVGNSKELSLFKDLPNEIKYHIEKYNKKLSIMVINQLFTPGMYDISRYLRQSMYYINFRRYYLPHGIDAGTSDEKKFTKILKSSFTKGYSEVPYIMGRYTKKKVTYIGPNPDFIEKIKIKLNKSSEEHSRLVIILNGMSLCDITIYTMLCDLIYSIPSEKINIIYDYKPLIISGIQLAMDTGISIPECPKKLICRSGWVYNDIDMPINALFKIHDAISIICDVNITSVKKLLDYIISITKYVGDKTLIETIIIANESLYRDDEKKLVGEKKIVDAFIRSKLSMVSIPSIKLFNERISLDNKYKNIVKKGEDFWSVIIKVIENIIILYNMMIQDKEVIASFVTAFGKTPSKIEPGCAVNPIIKTITNYLHLFESEYQRIIA